MKVHALYTRECYSGALKGRFDMDRHGRLDTCTLSREKKTKVKFLFESSFKKKKDRSVFVLRSFYLLRNMALKRVVFIFLFFNDTEIRSGRCSTKWRLLVCNVGMWI